MFAIQTRPWLVRLRWTSAIIETSVAVIAWSVPDIDLPLRRVALILVGAAASNAAIATWLSKEGTLPRGVAALGLAIDMLLLTAVLELTGGPFNPFAVVYAVQIALAVLTLGAVYAWPLGACASVCYGLLVYWHLNELEPGHHRVNDFPTHLFAMWMFLAAFAELAAFFVAQAAEALSEREAALDAMRARVSKSERLVSLTTLAAGAAHELSTPLATIALASRELERAVAAYQSADGLAEDARLIRMEVDRCRQILDQMSGRAGGIAEDLAEEFPLSAVFDDIRAGLPADQAARVHLDLTAAPTAVQLPRTGFRQAVLSLVRNACEASTGNVSVRVLQRGDRLSLTVRDDGPALAPDVLARAGDPFFTTKEPGRGIGLGLFLARVFAERLGGSVTLHSGNGTVADLELPARAEIA